MKELEIKLKSIYRHDESYNELKNRVYRRVSKNYLWDHITAGYLTLLTKIKQEDRELITPMEINYERKKA